MGYEASIEEGAKGQYDVLADWELVFSNQQREPHGLATRAAAARPAVVPFRAVTRAHGPKNQAPYTAAEYPDGHNQATERTGEHDHARAADVVLVADKEEPEHLAPYLPFLRTQSCPSDRTDGDQKAGRARPDQGAEPDRELGAGIGIAHARGHSDEHDQWREKETPPANRNSESQLSTGEHERHHRLGGVHAVLRNEVNP